MKKTLQHFFLLEITINIKRSFKCHKYVYETCLQRMSIINVFEVSCFEHKTMLLVHIKSDV